MDFTEARVGSRKRHARIPKLERNPTSRGIIRDT